MKTHLSRRTFLRGAGSTTLALPFLNAMATDSNDINVPRRLFCSSVLYGFVPSNFFPSQVDQSYELSPLLKPLGKHRQKFTVFNQLDHGQEGIGGHHSAHTFLSGINSKNARNHAEGNISMDQKMAEFVGSKTRYPSMQFGLSKTDNLSWTRSGIALTPITHIPSIYDALFTNDSKQQRLKLIRDYSVNQSILDSVRDNAKSLEKKLGKIDREKLDQYFTSIRSIETKISQSKLWINKEKPSAPGDYKLPRSSNSNSIVDKLPLLFDLIIMALQTDSTRSISLNINDIGISGGGLEGVDKTWHTLTHHGKSEEFLKPLAKIENFITTQFGHFLTKMDSIIEPNGKSLLDNSICLLGSGLGNASSHSNSNLPILLAGGDFKHRRHLKYKKEKSKRIATPLCQLYVTILQNLGLEIDEFGTAKGRIANFAGA
ncbi:MAG: DUF1552 domain-containing protein [Lentisphaeraceae bacterium]|nr:DUF1552 domain-containing protein [Lentisphaeraceae bacterium]